MKNSAKKLMPILLAMLCLLSACGAEHTAPSPDELPDVFEYAPSGTEVVPPKAADQVFSLYYDADGGMNPVLANSSDNLQFWSLIFDSVFIVDEDFNVYSEVVTEVKTEDFLWWVFTVDTTIPFSDGSTMTAEDIVYSIQRAQQTEYYRNRLDIIYGISAMSADTFAITTSYANSQFPALLNIPIVKKDTFYDDIPVGSGPFMISPGGNRLDLFVGNRHALEMPVSTIYLKNCEDISEKIRSFENATLDVVTNDPTGMYNLGYGSNNEKRYYDTSNLHYIGFNMDSKYFMTYPARRAVSYLLDRDYVVNKLMNNCGVATTVPVHPRSRLYHAQYDAELRSDPRKAEALFQSADVADYDKDGALEMMVTGIVVELDIRFIVNNDSSVKVEAARRLCEAMNELGITTTLWELSWTDYVTALENGDYDMYYGELRLTPDWNLTELFRPREAQVKKPEDDAPFVGINYGNVRDTAYMTLYEAYLAAADDAARADALDEVCRYISDTGVILPICFERRELLSHRGAITGCVPTQYDVFNKFYEWTINLK